MQFTRSDYQWFRCSTCRWVQFHIRCSIHASCSSTGGVVGGCSCGGSGSDGSGGGNGGCSSCGSGSGDGVVVVVVEVVVDLEWWL